MRFEILRISSYFSAFHFLLLLSSFIFHLLCTRVEVEMETRNDEMSQIADYYALFAIYRNMLKLKSSQHQHGKNQLPLFIKDPVCKTSNLNLAWPGLSSQVHTLRFRPDVNICIGMYILIYKGYFYSWSLSPDQSLWIFSKQILCLCSYFRAAERAIN